MMTFKKAIKMLEKEYEQAKKIEYVYSPLAYALYRVWQAADKDAEKERIKKEEMEK